MGSLLCWRAARNFNYLQLVYTIAIFFGLALIILQLYDIKIQKRSPQPPHICEEHNIAILSRLTKAFEDELLEADWKELLQMVERWWKQRKGDLSNEPINQIPYTKRGSCEPHANIFLLKTHKTASSTVMNILLRYGEFHNLTFAFPKQNYQYMYPEYFSAQNVYGFSSRKQQEFNIMCHHMRFSLTEVEKVMPNDTFYLTILRNPVTLMESSFAYYKHANSFYNATNIEDFLHNKTKLYQGNESDSAYAKNLMTFDLGFNHNGPESLKHFKLFYQAVDTMFDLVLIAEYFDESLVLLKHALCWSFDDVLSFPLNSRSNTSRHVLSVETKERIKSWNQLDWQLYMYFNNSFWDNVEKFGRERMKNEVEELRKRRAQISEKCLDDQVEPHQLKDKSIAPYQPNSTRILGYNLKSGLDGNDQLLCHRLVLPEIQYTNLLHEKQFGNKTVT